MTTVMCFKAEVIEMIFDSRRLKESRRQMKGGEEEGRMKNEESERNKEEKRKLKRMSDRRGRELLQSEGNRKEKKKNPDEIAVKLRQSRDLKYQQYRCASIGRFLFAGDEVVRQGNWHMLVCTFFFFFSPIGKIITKIMSSSSFCHFECHAWLYFCLVHQARGRDPGSRWTLDDKWEQWGKGLTAAHAARLCTVTWSTSGVDGTVL